jgi:hypothetical protein
MIKSLSDKALRRVADFSGVSVKNLVKTSSFEDEESVVAELFNFALDQAEMGDLNGQYESIKTNLEKKISNGTYDHDLSSKLWMYLVDNAAKLYDTVHGSGSDRMPDYFPKSIRMEVAQQLADNWYENEGSAMDEGREASRLRVAQEGGYQGYTNYETWAVSLWIDNDRDAYEYWKSQVEDILEQNSDIPREAQISELSSILADALRWNHEESLDGIEGVNKDLLTASLSKVDWDQIAARMLEAAQ